MQTQVSGSESDALRDGFGLSRRQLGEGVLTRPQRPV